MRSKKSKGAWGEYRAEGIEGAGEAESNCLSTIKMVLPKQWKRASFITLKLSTKYIFIAVFAWQKITKQVLGVAYYFMRVLLLGWITKIRGWDHGSYSEVHCDVKYNLTVKVVYCNIVESWSEGSTQHSVLLRVDPPPLNDKTRWLILNQCCFCNVHCEAVFK